MKVFESNFSNKHTADLAESRALTVTQQGGNGFISYL